jgi:plastocyanin
MPAVATLLLAGCATTGGAAWTFMPGPSGLPVPSVVLGSPGAGGELALENTTPQDDPLAFSETRLSAPAAAAVTVEYLNESDLPHNIAFFEGPDASAPRIAATEVVAGPGTRQEVSFTAPAQPGSYYIHCDVHPAQMQGTFVVS